MDIIGGMDTAARDFKYAVRTLRRSPGFVAVAALTRKSAIHSRPNA